MRLAFKTFGCRANSVDTDFLWAEAEKRGFTLVADNEPADAYVINSCTVTEGADRDARSCVRRFKRLNPQSYVAVVGCYGQVGKEELLQTPGVDIVLGTAEKFRVLDLITEPPPAKDFVINTSGFLPEEFLGSQRSRASIKVQDGCNFRCSFCIIPQARGRSRSLPKETVLNQVKQAWALGFKEIVFTGIHLAHYGWDQGTDLLSLIRGALKVGPRIRLSTLDPFEIPDELIGLVGKEPHLCPHFHIALQSGSDRVLAGMRRIYQAHEFVEVSHKIFKQEPDTFIGLDVIVGFPGETEKEFQKTVECLKNTPWTKLHVFPYSERKNTTAIQHPDKVAPERIAYRSSLLRELSEKRFTEFLASQLGKRREIVLEKKDKRGDWQGHTDNFIPTLCAPEQGESKETFEGVLAKIRGDKMWADPPERSTS